MSTLKQNTNEQVELAKSNSEGSEATKSANETAQRSISTADRSHTAAVMDTDKGS